MDKQHIKEKIVAAAFLGCVAVVSVWLVMAARSRAEFDSFGLTGEQLLDFQPVSSAWYAERARLVTDDPTEPNIIAHNLRLRYADKGRPHHPVFVRLVHGYNMCDCMRIKGYKVELLRDNRQLTTDDRQPSSSITLPYQLWRMTSSTGDVSIWVITMIRATDFTPTDIDTRDMAFPRVGVPDAQGWTPRGLSVKSLRHPIQNGRRFLRAKWNASRCDPLTFLGLRQPAWASDEMLALISAVSVRGAVPEEEITRHVLDAHALMANEYRAWRQSGE